jgi:fumarate hydratase class II
MARKEVIEQMVGKNPILVTALNPLIGYDLAAKIAKTAFAENRAVLDVAKEMTDLLRRRAGKCSEPDEHDSRRIYGILFLLGINRFSAFGWSLY